MEKRTNKVLISFFISVSAIIFTFICVIYIGIFSNNKRVHEEELLNRARSVINSFILARNWNAAYGGVFVEKTPGMQSNPYLKNPDMIGKDRKVYTKKNPALMIREISETAESENGFAFRISSLHPLNPNNAPDSFENWALDRFEQGDAEAFTRERIDKSTFFRYMAPLYVEESCLQCHDRGYGPGDVRGGISVRFNIDEMVAAQKKSLLITIGLAILTTFLLLAIIFRLVLNLYGQLKDAEKKLREMAVTDELTGLKNRRYLLERLGAEFKLAKRTNLPLSCISFDLDHFKRINDTYGHEVGDRVLKDIGLLAGNECRESDVSCRFGGEEFLIILPGTRMDGAMKAAEKLKKAILSLRIAMPEGVDLTISASFGVASFHPASRGYIEDISALLKQADEALYKAKRNGRNRVERMDEDENTVRSLA